MGREDEKLDVKGEKVNIFVRRTDESRILCRPILSGNKPILPFRAFDFYL